MGDILGLSIGTTNLVAARSGNPSVVRRSVLTLCDGRPAEVGVPSQNPELTSPNLLQSGVVLRGFVERVGDPVPLVGPDGSSHRGEALVALALEAIFRVAASGVSPSAVTVAVPAHWDSAVVGALRGALRASPALSPGGVPPMIVADATAALAALQAQPGLPGGGVVALCDFGGSGTSITLVDAGAGLAPIGDTVRSHDFSGDQIDQLLLEHILAGIRSGGTDDPSVTAAVGALTRLRGECQLAKERLSVETSTMVPVNLPGHRSDVRLTRAELESLIAEPLTSFLDTLGDVLERNRISAVNLAAVATVGGGAAIPVVTQRLSAELRVPVITAPMPGVAAAAGAAIGPVWGTGPVAPTNRVVAAAELPTGAAPAAWAIGAAGHAATESASDGAPSATFRALAWSQDDGDEAGLEFVGFGDVEEQPSAVAPAGARPEFEFEQDDDDAAAIPAWYRRPALLFGIAAILAAAGVSGLAVKLTSSQSTQTTTTTQVTKPGEAPAVPASIVSEKQPIATNGGNRQPAPATAVRPSANVPTAQQQPRELSEVNPPPEVKPPANTNGQPANPAAPDPQPANQPNGSGPVNQPNGSGPVNPAAGGSGPVNQPNGSGPANQPNGGGPANQPNGGGPANQPNGGGPVNPAAGGGGPVNPAAGGGGPVNPAAGGSGPANQPNGGGPANPPAGGQGPPFVFHPEPIPFPDDFGPIQPNPDSPPAGTGPVIKWTPVNPIPVNEIPANPGQIVITTSVVPGS